MKRSLGFMCFCMAIGMLFMMLIENRIVGIIASAVLLFVGYYFFCDC